MLDLTRASDEELLLELRKRGFQVTSTDNERKQMMRVSGSKSYFKRKDNGLCLKCPAPRSPGKSMCEKHLKMARDYQNQRNAKAREALR